MKEKYPLMADYSDSFRYFENHGCKYYPCHEMEHINCMFCYCPLYSLESCPGDYEMVRKNGKSIKSCMNCKYPHIIENYPEIIRKLMEHEASVTFELS